MLRISHFQHVTCVRAQPKTGGQLATRFSSSLMLDHLAYPHIIDAVFASSDSGALLALRSASHGFRERADARLFAHVAVHVADDTTYLRSPLAPAVNLPSLPFPLVASAREQLALSAKLKHTLIVDLHSPIPVDYTAWFRTFDLVRRVDPLAGAGFLLPAKTYVEYLDLRGGSRRDAAVGDWLTEIPDGVRRTVLHLTWTRGCSEQVRRMGRVYLPRGVDVVILLEPDGNVVEEDKGPTNVLVALLRTAKRVANSAASMTIVGLEMLSPYDLGGEVELAYDDEGDVAWTDAVREAVQRQLEERSLPRERVVLMRWDEWRGTDEASRM